MKNFFKSPTFIVLVLLLFITLLKIYRLNGGFVPGEPDERNYLEIVTNFRNSPLPQFDGIPLYHSPPFFHYLGFLFSFIFEGYLAVRLVSLVASFALAISLYFYLKQKTSVIAAALSSSLFCLLPLTVYYSRLGLLEMLIALFAFGFIACFEIAWKKNNWKWAMVSGLSLGFGLATKYSILPLVGIPLLVFGLHFLAEIFKSKSLGFLKLKSFWQKIFLLGVVFGSGAFVFLPITYFNFSLNPVEFKSQFKQVFALGGRSFETAVVRDYLQAIPSYFTWVGVILLIIGLVKSLKAIGKNYITLLTLALLGYALVKIALYVPRYVVITTPFLLVIMGLGLDWLLVRSMLLSNRLRLKTKLTQVILVGLMLVIILPGSWLAIRASYHTTFDEVGQYVKQENKDSLWVASNYWPSAFVDQVGYKISWYSADQRDTNSLSGGGKTYYLPSDKPLFDLMNQEGGWVIIETLYSQGFSLGRERKGPAEIIQKSQQPVKIFTDTSPNWPYFEEDANQLFVYHLPKK